MLGEPSVIKALENQIANMCSDAAHVSTHHITFFPLAFSKSSFSEPVYINDNIVPLLLTIIIVTSHNALN